MILFSDYVLNECWSETKHRHLTQVDCLQQSPSEAKEVSYIEATAATAGIKAQLVLSTH